MPLTPADPAATGGWLTPTGEAGRLIAAFPWATTPLGPLDNWPPHLRVLVNFMLGSGAPMALIWGQEHTFLYNDGYAQIIQDKHPAALGSTSREIFPEIWDALSPLFNQVMAGEPFVIENQELLLTRRGVTAPSYFSFNYTPIRDEHNHVGGFLAVVLETTGGVILEKERAQVFDTVLSAINDFAYTFDRAGRFTYVNKALLDLWGLTLAQAVGKNFFDLNYPAELATRLQAQIQDVIDQKRSVRDETPYESPTGASGFYEYILSPVLGPDGEVLVVAGSTRDITSRKEFELAAVAASEAKDDFLATLSHELRTPLNPALMLATENAGNPDLPAAVRADFKAITEQIAIEARLIDDLLDISRITHHKLTLNREAHDLHHILEQSINALSPDLEAKRLQLVRRLGSAQSLVVGDDVRLHQIFSNLLRNAVKFTPEGGSITVATRYRPAPPAVIVEITDTGIGLTAAEISRVFEPFAQGEHTNESETRFGGLGLGLAIARKLAEMHGGTITANSPGQHGGATFTVTLPAASGETVAPPPVTTASKSPFVRADNSRPRVLLVEDHAPSRKVLARLLSNRGIDVVEAASAGEALEKAKAIQLDLVISDLGLPDITGYELMTTLKSTYGCRGIALSGYGTEADIAQSKQVGFLAHLTKPVNTHALDAALLEFLPP